DCLNSLAKLSYPHVNVVICDNGSSDDSIVRLTQWSEKSAWPYRVLDRGAELSVPDDVELRVGIIKSGYNAGFAGGNNIAIRYALGRPTSYKYVWVLNNDTVVDGRSLQELVRALEANPDAGAAQSLLL